MISRVVASAFLSSMMVLGASAVSGQNYPNKPVRLVTSQVGGINDISARLIGPKVSARWGQPMVVQNFPTVVSIETVAKAAPDGYNLLISGSPLWTEPLLQNVSYDPIRDFSPITMLAGGTSVVVVHPSLPVKSIKELIALAKARPGELNFGTGGSGSTTHLSIELFSAMAGIKMVQVAFKGQGPNVIALVSGEIQLTFTGTGAAKTYIDSGRLRALAVSSAQPSMLVPNLPTIAASGLPGFEARSYVGLFAPAKTPAAIINRVNQEVVRAVEDVKEQFYSSDVEAVTSSPDELLATIKSERTKWGKVIKDIGLAPKNP